MAPDWISDAEPPPSRNTRQVQLLLMVGALNLATISIDILVLGRHLALALTLRLAVVPPFVLAGLALCRFSRSTRLQVQASAITIIVLALVSASLGQFAEEPVASRYMMATLFLIFGAALSVALPWHTTKWMTATATLGFAAIVSSGLRFPPRFANLDLVLFCATAAVSALYLRHRKDQQLARVVDLRRIDFVTPASCARPTTTCRCCPIPTR